jgi:hypothetical protein
VTELKRAAPHRSCYYYLEVVLGLEVPDLQLAAADDRERRCLDPADANDPSHPGRNQGLGCCSGQREIEDLVGLLAGHGGSVEVPVLGVRLQVREGLPQRGWVLGGEDRP